VQQPEDNTSACMHRALGIGDWRIKKRKKISNWRLENKEKKED
jgi:hypothetical protein